jgi:hypothetical protein
METPSPPFRAIPVNTKTLVCSLNVRFELIKLFHALEPMEMAPPTRKRKRMAAPGDAADEDGPEAVSVAGDVVSVKLETMSHEQRKGHLLGGRVDSKPFRNSVAVDIFVANHKRINVKISSNGCLQLTGGQCARHGLEAVELLLWKIRDAPGVYELTDPDPAAPIKMYVISVMRNISFSLGFCVSRETLGRLLNEHPDYQALWAPQYSYAGLNAKRWLPYRQRDVKSFHLAPADGAPARWQFGGLVEVDEYLRLQELARGPGASRKMRNDIVMTFLVFQSGKVIFSGLNSKTMRGPYRDFVDLVHASRASVEEKVGG